MAAEIHQRGGGPDVLSAYKKSQVGLLLLMKSPLEENLENSEV